MPRYTLPLDKISTQDSSEIGSVFANLANFGLVGESIGEGFVLGFETFEKTFAPLWEKIGKHFTGLKINNAKTEVVNSFKELLLDQIVIPENILREITLETKHLKNPLQIKTLVKLPNSNEFSFEAAFYEKKALVAVIREAMLSFLNTEVLKKINTEDELKQIQVAMLVSEKLQADISGKAKIADPKKNEIEILASWGELNEASAFDKVKFNPREFTVEDYSVSRQETQKIWLDGSFHNVAVSKKFQTERKLSEKNIQKIALALKKLQSALLVNLEIIFQVTGNKLIFTELKREDKSFLEEVITTNINLPLIKQLKPVFPGIATGMIKHIDRITDFRKIKRGEIAVVKSLNKGNLNFLKKASGIIVKNTAKFQENNAHVINQLGVSMAIGELSDYLEGVVTLDGKTGKVYKGSYFPLMGKVIQPSNQETLKTPTLTATKIFAYASDANKLLKTNLTAADGLGPVRLELHFTKAGFHPSKLLEKEVKEEFFQETIFHLSEISSKAVNKPVIYQLADFKTNELIHLHGGNVSETKEANPLLGLRGTERHLVNREFLTAELRIIKELRNKHNYKNLSISLPFVRTKKELLEIKKVLSANNLNRSPSFKLLVTISTPSNILSIEDFYDAGIDGFLIDYWDLANLIYGKDFTFEELTKIEDKAIEKALESVLKFSSRNSLFSGIFNFPLGSENNLITKLVSWGIKSISCPPDALKDSRENVFQAEKHLVTKN